MKGLKDFWLLNPKRVESFLFYLLIFFLPTQLGYHFWPNWAFVFGIRSDYLAPTIYLTDILLVALLLVARPKINKIYLLFILVFGVLNSVFSTLFWASIVKWIKVTELFLLATYVNQNKKLIKTPLFRKVFGVSLLIVSLLAIGQFILGRTVGWPFNYLGERSFNRQTPGISLQYIFGHEYLRPYSTFSHPNSLAGFLGLSLLLFGGVSLLPKILSLVSFVLSGSLGAFAALFSAVFFKRFSRVFLVVVLLATFATSFIHTTFNIESIDQRIAMSQVADKLILQKPLLGGGLSTFVVNSPIAQPVHNIFLLALVEAGIVGLTALIYLLYKGLQKVPNVFIFILVSGFLDHYLLTLQQNQLLLAIVLGLVL